MGNLKKRTETLKSGVAMTARHLLENLKKRTETHYRLHDAELLSSQNLKKRTETHSFRRDSRFTAV